MASIACTIVLNYLAAQGSVRKEIEKNYPGVVLALVTVLGFVPEEGKCPFCGIRSSSTKLKVHIYRCHRAELVAICGAVKEVMSSFVKKGRNVVVFGRSFRNLVEALEWVKREGLCVVRQISFAHS